MRYIALFFLIFSFTTPHNALANSGQGKAAISASLDGKLEAGKSVGVTLKLFEIDGKKPVSEKDLEVVHTKKLHLLVIDGSLADYQHIHPVAGKNVGEYSFNFTPRTNGSYRIWADFTPVKTKTQQYAYTDIGEQKEKAEIDESLNNEVTIDGYNFKLVFDSPLAEGAASLGTIKVTDESGKPVEKLQPVMGAFAHIVAFGEDRESVLHVHPMGKEPESEEEKGGPELQFHIAPESSGFVKLFAQVKIDGKDIFAPFGLMVGHAVASN